MKLLLQIIFSHVLIAASLCGYTAFDNQIGSILAKADCGDCGKRSAQGPRGPQGIQGIQGEPGTPFAPDFAMVYLPGSSSGTAVASGCPVPFSSITNTPSNTNFSLSNGTFFAAGTVNVNATGYYLVTFGIMPVATTTTTGAFALEINQVSGVAQQSIDFNQTVSGLGVGEEVHIQQMYTLTTLIHITSAPSTLQVFNISSSGSITLNDERASSSGIAAYMTIVKLQ